MGTKQNFLSITTIIKEIYYVHMSDYVRGDTHGLNIVNQNLLMIPTVY